VDLYIQVGVLLVMASMFALVAYFYSVSFATGIETREQLTEPSVNYSLDSSVTTPTFLVDARTFVQWAINAKGQRELFLVYPSSITPAEATYGQYLREITVKLDGGDVSNRSLKIHPQTDTQVSNAYEVSDQSPKTVDYLRVYAEESKLRGSDEMVTVYTFTDSATNAVIYVCYIK